MTDKTNLLDRGDFESWYRRNIDQDADFQVGREYEDECVYVGWCAWREMHSRFSALITSLRAKADQLSEDRARAYAKGRAAGLDSASVACSLLSGDYDRYSDVDSRNAAIKCHEAIRAIKEEYDDMCPVCGGLGGCSCDRPAQVTP